MYSIPARFPSATCKIKLISVLCLALLTATAGAQEIPTPKDKPYPGTIQLDIDATNVNQKIFTVHERIPVQAGKLTLLYPEWLPGEHSPTAQLAHMANFKISGNQQRIEWQRDPLNMYAFHLVVPAGVTAIDAEFQYLSPISAAQGANFASAEIAALHWEKLLVYPAGYFIRGISVKPEVRIPDGWKFASALDGAEQAGATIHFQSVDLEDLVDSPLYAGKYFARFDLDPGAKVPVYFDFFADDAASLVATPEQIGFHRALLQQAYKLFGARHFSHFDFLVAASDKFSFAGLEHHQSSENGVKPSYFTEWDDKGFAPRGYLIPHEFTHSWDGKFRRPAGQFTPNFNTPMQNQLLWLYEGQTEYWGYVLAARSGLLSTQQVKDSIAMVAAYYSTEKSKQWRSVQETTNDPVINQRRPLAWRSVQGGEDYYMEGQLIWLDVDAKIRALSKDTRSLNDFALKFFGMDDGRYKPLTYTFEDIVATLNAVQPYDWAKYLRSQLDSHGSAPLDGIAASGWKLVFTDKPSDYNKAINAASNVADFWYSLGFIIGRDDRIEEVLWDGPAFKAGMTGDVVLLGVNGREYKEDVLKRAVTAARTSHQPIELLLKKEGGFETVRIAYFDGLKYPHLEQIDGAANRLDAILAPLK